MLTVSVLLFCTLFSNTISQIVPLRFDQAISRLGRHRNLSPENAIKDVEYDFAPEQMLEYMANNKTSVCEQEFELILEAASKSEMWAIKILDAWGKPLPSGVLKGNYYWLGDYNECLHPMYNPTNKSYVTQPFDTQHCTLAPKNSQVSLNGPPGIVLGVCIPLSCSRQEAVSLIHSLFKKSNVTEDQLVCSSEPANGQKGFTGGAIATIVILSLLGALVLVGTIVDFMLLPKVDSGGHRSSNGNGYNHLVGGGINESASVKLPRRSFPTLIDTTPFTSFLAEFSALRTLRRVFTMKQKKDDDSFLFINGIRVLALFWVIIGHSLAFGLSYTSNIVDVLVWTRDLSFQLLINAVFSVDTFFVLSGFLTAILFVRQVKKEEKLSFRFMSLYYIHRYIRLTPTFLLVILVSINLTPYFGQGPVYPSQEGFETNGCRTKHWWTSILYVSNLVKPDDMCLGIAWYLHNDMQFHWIAPLSLIPFALGRKSLSICITILFVLIGIGSILTILLYYPNMTLNFLLAFDQTAGPNFFNSIYITPWCRISAYAVGMLTGYFVNDAGRQYRINKYTKFFGTVLAILFALACLFTTYPDYILASGLNRSVLVAHQSLSRTLWAIVIGWLLILCSTNQGGIVNRILSWPIWSPLAKLNYSCYLIHATFLVYIINSQTIPFYYQGNLVVINFVSHIFFSYAAAVLVTIFFETPFFIIEKKLFKR